jgi:flagellar basal-body rod modification protein FlgD
MSAISSIQSGTPDPSTQLANGANSALGKDDFLKLFIAQLQHQDPSSPMDANQSMEQMASFSMVEQLTNLSAQQTKMAQSTAQASAVALIGRTVTWTDASKATHTGAVERVSTIGGKTSLTVSGTDGVDPSSITQVA